VVRSMVPIHSSPRMPITVPASQALARRGECTGGKVRVGSARRAMARGEAAVQACRWGYARRACGGEQAAASHGRASRVAAAVQYA